MSQSQSNSSAVNTDTNTTLTSWQLDAQTKALGELSLPISERLSVGRGDDNDVVLGSKQVSRHHAVVTVQDGDLLLTDLDSSNGTFVNDKQLTAEQSQALHVGDVVHFASFAFVVNTPTAPASATAQRTDIKSAPQSTSSMPTGAQDPASPQVSNDQEIVPDTAALSSAQHANTAHADTTAQSTAHAAVTDTAHTDDLKAASTRPSADGSVSQPVADSDPDVVQATSTTKQTAPNDMPTDTEVARHNHGNKTQDNFGLNKGLDDDVNKPSDKEVARTTDPSKPQKSGGGWLIWLLVAIVLIGLAIWLFNNGTMT